MALGGLALARSRHTAMMHIGLCQLRVAPGPETFTLHVYDGGQHLRHPQLPGLPLPRP